MWDDTEPAGANPYHEIDWSIADWRPEEAPAYDSFDLIDQMFDDLDGLMHEALA